MQTAAFKLPFAFLRNDFKGLNYKVLLISRPLLKRQTMDDRLENILKNIRQLEDELLTELDKKKKDFLYEVHEKRIRFSRC